MFVDLDWPLNASSLLSASAELLVISTFHWRLVSKAPSSSVLIGPRPWRHTPRLIVMHVVFRSLLKIFVHAAKQACKLLQCNKANYQEPASINGPHNTRVYARASLLISYTNENLDAHIYTVTTCDDAFLSYSRRRTLPWVVVYSENIYLYMVNVYGTTDTSNLFINFSEECSSLVVSNAYMDFIVFKSSKLPSRSVFSL